MYVGSAVKYPHRVKGHLNSLKRGQHKNRKLQSHCDKYGVEDLIFEKLEYVKNSVDLIPREQYYIDTLKPVFNICKIAGSSLGVVRTDEYKRKMSLSKAGGKHRPECNAEKSARMKGKKRPNFRYKHSEETKAKIKANHASARPIIQTCLCGHLVKEYPCILSAAKELGISPATISSCLRGFTKSSAGYLWTYK